MNAGLLPTAFLSAAESFLNGMLALDPASTARLAALSGKSLHVECTFPPVAFIMLVTDDGILMLRDNGVDATASLRGSAGALLGLLVNKGNRARRDARMTFSGDAGFMEAFQDALVNLDVDWEYRISKFIGDIPTQAISDGVAGARDFARKSAANLREDLDAWLHDERRLFPDGVELARFYTAVDRLRLRIDRLEARTARLQAGVNR